MSHFQNIAFQSGLRNAQSEQRHSQQQGASRSLANMPIYPEEDQPAQLLSSFKSTAKPRNFSSDLLQQALAAKSNLGLCDGLARSDALQSLRSYGSQSLQDSPGKNPRYQEPGVPRGGYQGAASGMGQSLHYQSANSGLGQSVQNPGYQGANSGILGQSVQSPRYQNSPSMMSVQNTRYLHPALTSSQGEARREQQGQEKWYKSLQEDVSFANDLLNDRKGAEDSKEGSFTPFQPPSHLNTVEDEDEFLYGGSTPMTETCGETPRMEEVASVKEGTGNWSDEDIMIIEDSSNVKLPRAPLESPKPKSNKEATAIPLKDLSWKSSTAWKDETLYNQKTEKAKAADLPRTTYQGSNRPESETEGAVVALEKASSAQQSEKMTTQEKKSKYANAALLLKKQLDVNMMSNSPSVEMREQMADHTLLEKSMRSVSAEEPSKESPYSHLLVNIEKASSVPQKRVVSTTENSSSGRSSKSRNSSPLTVQHDKDIISKPQTSSARVLRDPFESIRRQEPPKVIAPRYLDGYMKPKPDKYSKELYEKKNMPLESPKRISPTSYRYRSPSNERRRDRSRSPEYRSRHRSRPRIPDERSRERSPRFRNRSRGRSPPYYYEDRPRRDKSCDKRVTAKRQHSPDSPRLGEKRPSKREVPERQKPIPPSVEETLSQERPVSSRLFPKSMSPDMAAMFMKESELPKEPVRPKVPEKQVDLVVESVDQDLVIQKLNFTIKLLQQVECLNQLVAEMQEEEVTKKVNILAQKVELALDANTRRYEAQQAAAASAYPAANTFAQPLRLEMSYPHQSMYHPTVPIIPQAPISQPYPSYSYPASAPAPAYPASSYQYGQPYPPPDMYSQLSPVPSPSVYSQGSSSAYSQPPPPASKLANAAPPPPSRWLRSVPVLTEEELSKESDAALCVAAENEPELMSQYCRRVEERNLSHRKLTNLSNQVTEIQRMRDDFQKRSKKVRAGDDGYFISQFQVLQEKASVELKREIHDLKRLSEEVQDLESKIHPNSLKKCKENMNKLAPEEKKPTTVYSCFDTGKHFCVQCSSKFSSVLEMVQHLHSEEHLQHENTMSVASKEPPKVEVKATALQAVKGVEFVKPVNAFYCTLCEETLLNPLFVEQHVKGHDHTVKYLNYLKENPIYEAKLKIIESARASTKAKENRLKELEEIAKATQILKKKKQDSEKRREDSELQLQKVHKQLQGERLKDKEVMELDDEEEEDDGPPTLASMKKKAIRVNLAEKEAKWAGEKDKEPPQKKPKQPVIYIGRAPNFKPKEKVVKKGPEKWVKGRKDRGERKDKDEQEKDKEVKDLARNLDEWNKHYGPALPLAPNTPAGKIVSPTEERRKEAEPAVDKSGGSRWNRAHSKKEDVPLDKKINEAPQKVFGCQSEAEAKSAQGDRKHEADGKTLQKKEATIVQLQMNEPKTSDPAVTQALKNILYGSKSKPPGMDTDLSVIKLPEEPPPPAKVIVKPQPKLQPKKPLTEEEKDFILLGINKSDMEPIAIPKPPPSSLMKARASPPIKTTKASISPFSVTVPSIPKIVSPKVKVPSLNLQVPPPNLQVPPPNLQVPPPTLHVPPPNLHVPPPTLHVPPPNLQVPPPNVLSNSPVRHAPYGQAFNSPVRFHTPGYTRPQFNYVDEVVDMDSEYEDGTGFEIHVGTPIPKAIPYPNERRSGYSKPTGTSPDKKKPKTEVLQASKPDHKDSKTIVTKQNTCDSNLKTTTETGVGLKEDRLICASVLNSVITMIVEKRLENSLYLNTKTSNVNEPEVIHKSTGIKSPKDLQSFQLDPISSSVSADSAVCDKLQVHADKASHIVGSQEVVESEGTVSSLCVTHVETFHIFSKEDLQLTKELSMDFSELVFKSTSADINTENCNTIESEKHLELEPPKNLTICDRKDSNTISNQEDLTSLTQQIYVQETAQRKVSNITETTEVNTSQIDINKNENNALVSKELTSEENIPSITTSQENPVMFEQKIISSDDVLKTSDDIAILENKLDEAPKTLDDIAILKSKSDNIAILENRTESNSSMEHIHLMEYESISETPLIHGIEHFMDSKEENLQQKNSISAEESLRTLSSKKETVMPLKYENAGALSTSIVDENTEGMENSVSDIQAMDVKQTDIPLTTSEDVVESPSFKHESMMPMKKENTGELTTSIAEENELKSPTAVMESSSVKLCASGIEAMDVEKTDILLTSTEDVVKSSNNQPFEQESVMPLKGENSELSTSIIEENVRKSPAEVSSLKLCVSGTEKMDVEQTEDDDIQIVFEATMNSQCPRDERIKVEEVVLIPKTEEVDADTVFTERLSNPQKLHHENNSPDSCISGIRSFDETHRNSPSNLGKDCSKESTIHKEELLGVTSDIAILESKSDDIAILENKTDEVPKTPNDIPIIENKTESNSSMEHINLMEYEDISETPLIHGIEHFMDSKEEYQQQKISIRAEESLRNLSSKQETVLPLKDENAGALSTSIVDENEKMEDIVSDIQAMDVEQTDIPLTSSEDVESPSFEHESVMPLKEEHSGELTTSIAEENELKSPTAEMESSSVKLCASGIEGKDVEKTDILLTSTEDVVESSNNQSFKQESVMPLKEENSCELSISIAHETDQKSPTEVMESRSLTLKVSGIEAMDVEQANILLTPTEDIVGSSNSQPFKQESVMPLKGENSGELSTSIVEENEQKSPAEVSSLKLCVSGTEKMDVEQTEDDDIQIVFEATLNSQCPRDERIKVEEIVLIPKTEEVDAETVSTERLSNPQKSHHENNSPDSCISGIRSFDEMHQNSPSDLGKNCSKESSMRKEDLLGASSDTPEENSEQMEVLEACNTESGLALDDQVKAIQCPIDIELLANECNIENAIGKEDTFKLPLSEVRSLDKEYSGCTAEKMHSTKEVEYLADRTVHQVHAEEQENFENKLSITDIYGDLKQAENPIIEKSEDFATSDLLSESVPPLGIEVIEHASQDMKTTDESIIEDSDSKDNSGVNSSVPSLDKFDMDDSLSNSLSDNPPILSEEPENVCQLATEKKQDSDTDEYETEDGK